MGVHVPSQFSAYTLYAQDLVKSGKGNVWWRSWRELPPPAPFADCQATDPDFSWQGQWPAPVTGNAASPAALASGQRGLPEGTQRLPPRDGEGLRRG
jgi:hypothetical protein